MAIFEIIVYSTTGFIDDIQLVFANGYQSPPHFDHTGLISKAEKITNNRTIKRITVVAKTYIESLIFDFDDQSQVTFGTSAGGTLLQLEIYGQITGFFGSLASRFDLKRSVIYPR